MHRALIKIVVSLALAVGLTLTVAGTAPTASAAPAAAAAKADCSTQQAAYNAALADQQAIKAKLAKAKHHLKVLKKKLRRAKAAHQPVRIHRLKKQIRQTRHRVTRLYHRLQVAKARTDDARTALAACIAGGGGGGGGGGATDTPLQALCDAGLPQALCDGLAQLAGGGLPSDLSLQQLCDAAPQFQPLCDAADAGTLPTDPSALTTLLQPILDALGLGNLLKSPAELTSIQALCDAGVPQSVCDGLAGLAGGGLPSDLSLQQLCDAQPDAQPLCDAVNTDGGLPDLTTLTTLLGPILDLLGLGGLLGGLPLP
ncbi:MAG TPA: hypothetical protein VNS55_13330 [Nocardioides sp.]|nr:hypothetical protein [Nocardioides sp.]